MAAVYGGVTTCADLVRAERVGRVELAFRRGPDERTYLSRQYAGYPFHVCRPHRFVGDPPGMVTLYLQTVAGGIFEGDRLQVRIVAEPGAELHVTSQASMIVHSMERNRAEQAVAIEAGENALVEYLPDTAILFPRARLESCIGVQAHETASVIIADAFLCHDPSGDGATFEALASDTVVSMPTGQVIVRDRFRVTGELLARGLPGLNGMHFAQGTVMMIHRRTPLDLFLNAVRQALEPLPGIYAGASLLPTGAGVWARILAHDGHALRQAMLSVWSSARAQITGTRPAVRRK